MDPDQDICWPAVLTVIGLVVVIIVAALVVVAP